MAGGNLEEIAFDESGGRWFSYGVGQMGRFAPAQLGAAADIAPAVLVTATGVGDTKAIALFSAPAALPLYSALP